jgi:hypothetical protein
MAVSASFWSPYKAQRTGLLGFTCPHHCSKFTYPLCKSWQPLCYGVCLVQAIVPVSMPVWKWWLARVPHRLHTGHNGLYLSHSITCNSDSLGWLSLWTSTLGTICTGGCCINCWLWGYIFCKGFRVSEVRQPMNFGGIRVAS